jgi:uncharacterized lipoprotein YmbA
MKILKACALVLLLTSCGLLSKSKINVYKLDTIPSAAPVAAMLRAVPIAIDSLEIPPGFDRRDVVVRKADHQLDIRGTEQWSASMEPMVLHTLAFDLASRLPEGMVILPGQAKPLGPQRAIDVVIEEIAAGPENVAVLDTRWVVRENGRATTTHHERITIDLPALDSANVAMGFSRAIATLADRIAVHVGGS